MYFGILRPVLTATLSIGFGLLVTTASAKPIDLHQKLLDASASDPQLERQVSQMLFETLVPKPAVEAFDGAVLHGLPGRDAMPFDLSFLLPA